LRHHVYTEFCRDFLQKAGVWAAAGSNCRSRHKGLWRDSLCGGTGTDFAGAEKFFARTRDLIRPIRESAIRVVSD
jgi:hypothetical protein